MKYQWNRTGEQSQMTSNTTMYINISTSYTQGFLLVAILMQMVTNVKNNKQMIKMFKVKQMPWVMFLLFFFNKLGILK